MKWNELTRSGQYLISIIFRNFHDHINLISFILYIINSVQLHFFKISITKFSSASPYLEQWKRILNDDSLIRTLIKFLVNPGYFLAQLRKSLFGAEVDFHRGYFPVPFERLEVTGGDLSVVSAFIQLTECPGTGQLTGGQNIRLQ